MSAQQTSEIVIGEVSPGIWRSRWGYHPCSPETYQMLRRLKKEYWRAVAQEATWQRWDRKEPQNRIARKVLRDALGRRCGYDGIIGNIPEPKTSDVFTSCTNEKRVRTYKNTVKGKEVITQVPYYARVVDDHGLRAALVRCMPVATAAEVKPLDLHTVARMVSLSQRLAPAA
jgi:hypothetical protein